MAYISQNPWTAEVLASQAFDSESELQQKLAQAAACEQPWNNAGFAHRAQCFQQLAVLLVQHKQQLANVMHQEMGKLILEAQGEIVKSADACRHFADYAEALLSCDNIDTEYHSATVHYQAIGTVLGVMPWNFPLWQIIRFIAPTMMAGNTVLLKPAENSALLANLLAELIAQAGFMHGSYQNLFIDNGQCADVIACDTVKGVSITGSEAAGRSVAASAGQALKKCVLELGGSDAFLILHDADIEHAAKVAAESRFSNAGQTCIAAKRFIVVERVARQFIRAFKQQAGLFQCDSNNPANSTMAPLAKPTLRQQLHQQVMSSIEKGAVVLLGCESGEDFCDYPASILDHVSAGMPAFDEELFGPVASIIHVADTQAAIAVANNSRFGLAATVFTADKSTAQQVALQLQCGSVFVNAQVKSDVRLPFGGCKQSGFGREMAQLGIREFTNAKTVVID